MTALVPSNHVLDGEVLSPVSDEGDLTIAIRVNPFDLASTIYVQRDSSMTISEIVSSLRGTLPGGFEEFGEIDINGYWVPREVWHRVRAKPVFDGRPSVVGAKIVFHGGQKMSTKNILAIVAAVALLAATAWIGGGGLAAAGLGEAFAAGTFGATAAAAAVGLAGTAALIALSPVPSTQIDSPTGGGASGDGDAGISTNSLRPLQYLDVVLGRLFVSPPQVIASYTTMSDGVITVHGVVGMAGEYDPDDMEDYLRINDVAAAEFDGLVYQIRPGTLTDPPITIANKTVFEQRVNAQLTGPLLTPGSSYLKHNDLSLDLPKWINFTTRGAARKVTIRINWPAGASELDGDPPGFPIRVEFRRKGETTWQHAPECHFYETIAYGVPHRAEIVFDWDYDAYGFDVNFFGTIPTGVGFPLYGFYRAAPDGMSFSRRYFASAPYFCADWRIATGISMPSGETSLRLGPTMTNAPFPQSGWTITTSSNQAAAYALMDYNRSNGWTSTGSGPHTITFEFDQLYRIAFIGWDYNSDSNRPTSWTWESSVDGITWELACATTWSAGGNPVSFWANFGSIHCGDRIKPFRIRPCKFMRMTIDATGPSATTNGPVGINEVYFSLCGAPAISKTLTSGSWTTVTGFPANIFFDSDRFIFPMDPDVWPPDVYDFRVRRGTMYYTRHGNTFLPFTYQFQSQADDNVRFFDPIAGDGTSGNPYYMLLTQDEFRGDAVVEMFQSLKDDYPLNLDGVKTALIAVEVPGAQISSITSMFHSVMPIFNGTDWTDIAPTNNGAALFRWVMTGTENARPFALEAIDDDLLEDAYNFCQANGIEVNLLISGGENIEDVIQLIAGAMFGFVARSAKWGIVIDRDRTGDIISQNFSPINSRSLSMDISFSDVAHALYVEFTDEDDSYNTRFITVFLDGYNEDGSGGLIAATNYDSIKYRGPTNATAAAARGLYDLRVSFFRNIRYRLTIGIENLMTSRGRLVGLTHDLVSQYHAYTTIIAPIISGPNITGLYLEDVKLTEQTFNDFFAPTNIFAESDIFDIEVSIGAAITLNDGTVVIKAIDTIDVNDNTITFTTPFLDDGKIEEDFQVGIGPIGQEHLRCLVLGVERTRDFEATIQLVDEAPEIHLPPP